MYLDASHDVMKTIENAVRILAREPNPIPIPYDRQKSYTPRSLVGGLYAIAESIARVASAMEAEAASRQVVVQPLVCNSGAQNRKFKGDSND